MFSFVGLSMFNISYNIAGGFLFEYLEGSTEMGASYDVVTARNAHVKAITETVMDLVREFATKQKQFIQDPGNPEGPNATEPTTPVTNATDLPHTIIPLDQTTGGNTSGSGRKRRDVEGLDHHGRSEAASNMKGVISAADNANSVEDSWNSVEDDANSAPDDANSVEDSWNSVPDDANSVPDSWNSEADHRRSADAASITNGSFSDNLSGGINSSSANDTAGTVTVTAGTVTVTAGTVTADADSNLTTETQWVEITTTEDTTTTPEPWTPERAIDNIDDSVRKVCRDELKVFQAEVYDISGSGWTGEDWDTGGEELTKWNFYSSFLFSVTITTTIGYGNIAPKSIMGKFAVVMYAILGIPACVCWLGLMGNYMATGVKVMYYAARGGCWYFWCCGCSCLRKVKPEPPKPIPIEKRTVPSSFTISVIFAYLLLGAWLFSAWEGWAYGDAAYFCFITLSTVGFGDYVPGFESVDNRKTVAASIYIILGLALLSMCFQLIQDDVVEWVTWILAKVKGAFIEDEDAAAAAKANVSANCPKLDSSCILVSNSSHSISNSDSSVHLRVTDVADQYIFDFGTNKRVPCGDHTRYVFDTDRDGYTPHTGTGDSCTFTSNNNNWHALSLLSKTSLGPISGKRLRTCVFFRKSRSFFRKSTRKTKKPMNDV